MISAFQSREFGFSLELNEQQLAQVNEYRRNKKYQDEQAAKAKRGDAKKKHLQKARLFLNLNMRQALKGTG